MGNNIVAIVLLALAGMFLLAVERKLITDVRFSTVANIVTVVGFFFLVYTLVVPRDDSCTIILGDQVNVPQQIIEINSSMEASIYVTDPTINNLRFSWSAIYGRMNPPNAIGTPVSKYFAPGAAVAHDIITVEVGKDGCKAEKRIRDISVVLINSTNTPYSGPLCQDTIWVKVKIASVLSFEMNWLLVSSRCK